LITLNRGRPAESEYARRNQDKSRNHRSVGSSLDLDELEYIQFLYPSDPDFAQEFEEREPEAQTMLENLRDIEATLRDLDRGKIRIQ
jgi:dethiobiotin synthetase